MRVTNARSGFLTPESAFPTLRKIYIRAVERRDRWATEQLERPIQIGAQNLDGAVHPSFTRSSQTVCVRAPAQHRIGAEGEGFDDVGAPANAAIHPYFDLTVDRLDRFGQRTQRSLNTIQLAGAMIRHRDCRSAFVNRTTRIVPGQHTFDYDRPLPLFANPVQVSPSYCRLSQGSSDIDKRQRTFAGNDNILKHGQAAIEQIARKPARTRKYLRKIRNLLQRATAEQLFHPVAKVTFADSSHRRVDRDHQRREAGSARSCDPGFRGGSSAYQIKLVKDRTRRARLHILQ